MLLVGEGPDDIGDSELEGALSPRRQGVVEILLSRLLRDRFAVEPLISTRAIKDLKTVKGLPKKVAALLLTSEFEHIVVVLDRDAAPERYEELRQGLALVPDQGKRCVVGLAVEMLEAWLLADKGSWKKVFDRVPSALPTRPEDCWGVKSSPRHPKTLLRLALEECNCATIKEQSNAKRELARAVDLNTLESSCPQGFGQIVEAIHSQWFPWVRE
ncbi:MAG: DUF4276 family protein [Candidatus Eremiobacteraeota bacterium]|nr:DUF4276 family protein [Candidatus Eremiobacteraeota bacterium]